MRATHSRIPSTVSSSRLAKGRRLPAAVSIAALACAVATVPLRAADVTWDNGAANMQWDTSSMNWTGAAWNNGNGDGAVFGLTGAGAINLPGLVKVDSINFGADGYSLSGAGPINFVDGTSTQTSGVVNVAAASSATINTTINSNVGFQKIGSGTLTLNGAAGSIVGNVPLDGRATVQADVIVGGATGPLDGGFLRLANANALPSNTRVAISTGYLDIGSNNVTIGQLNYVNQLNGSNWNTTLNANNGVIGSGTLRVLGDITVMGQAGGNSSNAIAANVDLGGGTQVVRTSAQGQFSLNAALIFTGNLSNGSLLKTVGYSFNGVMAPADGMSLFGNNTYTGPTYMNGGNNVIAGTNATSLIQVSGISGGGTALTLFGANGSAQNATTIQAFAGGSFVLDNNASSGNTSLIFGPAVAAAQNNNRIADNAEVQLRDGNFTYRGQSTVAASETFGNLNLMGGNDVVTITPNGTGGTATVTASGNLTMAPRSTMQISSGSLGNQAKLFVTGTIPAADSTGILPRIVGTNDFVTYNGATGMTPYTGYATDFNTAGANVAITAATAVASSVNINALKRTGSFTLTINSGQTLGITSGMILNTSGTGTMTGGTVAFGSNPGVLFGTNNIQSAVTGSNGLIFASGTGTLAGDASGLSGTMDVLSGSANINTNTFAGPIKLRNATLSLNVSQTLPSAGAITIGVPENQSNLIGLIPTVSTSTAGANAVFNRDIIVDNGAKTAGGVPLRYTFYPSLTPLSNATGTQTFSGNVTLNSPLRVQGGGAANGSTGATVFSGNISGSDQIYVANGRVIYSGQYSNAGGFSFGDTGFTAKGIFTGTPIGSAPLQLAGGSGNANPSSIAYNNGSLPTGPIRVWNSALTVVASIIPLQNSTINNTIFLDNSPQSGGGDVNANVGAGIVANWNGPLTGGGGIIKSGAGQLVLGNANNSQTGTVAVNAGILSANGALPSSSVAVNSGGTLGGTGVLSGDVNVNSGGSIAPGNSIGTLGTGNLTITGTVNSDIDMNFGGSNPTADLLNVTGNVNLTGATLNLNELNVAGIGTYLLVSNDGNEPVNGTFGTITGVPGGYTATVDYAFNGTDSVGRTGNGNDIAVTLVPEPGTAAGLAIAGGLIAMRRRRKTNA